MNSSHTLRQVYALLGVGHAAGQLITGGKVPPVQTRMRHRNSSGLCGLREEGPGQRFQTIRIERGHCLEFRTRRTQRGASAPDLRGNASAAGGSRASKGAISITGMRAEDIFAGAGCHSRPMCAATTERCPRVASPTRRAGEIIIRDLFCYDKKYFVLLQKVSRALGKTKVGREELP